MTTPWSLTIDCHDPQAVARFWAVALGYVDRAPPAGWDTWTDWFRHFVVPEEHWADVAALCDPDGVVPSISLLRVAEAKVVKNRVHLDLQVTGGSAIGPGRDLDLVTMADPEGKELCVV